jgi:hypothetical protein
MSRLQRLFEFRNVRPDARTPRPAAALVAAFSFLAVLGACDLFVPNQVPSTEREQPPRIDPPPNPTPTTLTRAPYLQALEETSILIAFRTKDSVGASVDYGPTTAYGSSVSGPATQLHAIEIEGLSPGRRYFYRVRAGGETLVEGERYFFDTDAGASDPEFSFFVTGDVGEPGGAQAVTGERVLLTLPRAEIGLITGDVVYPDGAAEDYDAYLMTPWAPLMRNVAIYPALGNHDWHVDPDQNFAQQWYLPNNEHYYSFDRGNAHFIALDTRNGNIWDRENQVAWLRADLEAHRDATWTFVYYHHPGYTCTYKGNEDAVIENFHPLFDEFGVDVAFMGHAHTYERLYPMRGPTPLNQEHDPHYVDPDGTIYIITGCGAKLKSTTTADCDINAVAIDETIMFTHATVRGNELHIRQIESKTGTLRDEISVTKSGL